MKQKKNIQNELELMDTFRNLCLTYEEMSVLRMQEIREYVISTRTFFEKLSNIYFHVKSSYKKEVLHMETKKAKKNDTALKKELAVLVTSNTRLHGTITHDVAHYFSETIKDNDSDVMIIGKLGKIYYQTLPPPAGGRDFIYHEIPDVKLPLDDLRSIVHHLQKYKNITVFFGQYQTMLHQEPHATSITGDIPMTEEEFRNQLNEALKQEQGKTSLYRTYVNLQKESTKSKQDTDKAKSSTRYLFEPELAYILDYFETNILSSLFKQALHESQLARYASRVQAMETALGNIEKNEKKLTQQKRRAIAMQKNKDQQQRIAGMQLWHQK